MKVEMLGTGREDVVFSVDGRKIDMACETKIYDRAKPDELTLCFYPDQATDRNTKQPINDGVRTAIVEYIKKEFSEGAVKFEIKLRGKDGRLQNVE